MPPPSALRRKIIIKNKKKHHHHHKKTTTPSPENQSTETIENNGEVPQHAPPLQTRQVNIKLFFNKYNSGSNFISLVGYLCFQILIYIQVYNFDRVNCFNHFLTFCLFIIRSKYFIFHFLIHISLYPCP